MANFIKVTRIYKVAKTGAMKTQTITLAVDAVESVRASNRLGYPEHRATISLKSGGSIDVSDKSSAVNKALGVR